jgi:HAMP domain-containing protein
MKWKWHLSLQAKITIAFGFVSLYLMGMMLAILNIFAGSLISQEILTSFYALAAPLFVIAGLMGVIIIQLIVFKLIKKPVKELLDAIERVSLGDLTRPAMVYNKDDLGWLSNCFNKMTLHLAYLVKTAQEHAKYMLSKSEQNFNQVVTMEKHYLHLMAQFEVFKGLVVNHQEMIYLYQEDLAKAIKEEITESFWMDLKDTNDESKKILDRTSVLLCEIIEKFDQTTQVPKTIESLYVINEQMLILNNILSNSSSLLFGFREKLGLWLQAVQTAEGRQDERAKELAAIYAQLTGLEKILAEEHVRFKNIKSQLGKMVRTASNMEIHLAQFKT